MKRKILIGVLIMVGLVGTTWISKMDKEPSSLQNPNNSDHVVLESCIWIEVKGAVRKPDIYCVPKGGIVDDAINLAGGVTSGGDLSTVNRVAKVKDEMMIHVPFVQEYQQAKISINQATIDELMKIPLIGESKARNIVEFRNKNGHFLRLEDITKVNGIGNETYLKIKDYIKL